MAAVCQSDSFGDLRQGMQMMLLDELQKLSEAWPLTEVDWDAAASRLEEKINQEALLVASKADHEWRYALLTSEVISVICRQVGPFPNDIVGLQYLQKNITPTELLAKSQEAVPDNDPRETIRRKFVAILISAHKDYASNQARVLKVGRAIEVSCYNAAVRISKASDEPPLRNWDSVDFVDNYSTRCGTIISLLDPTSSACQAYGSTLVGRLISEELAPSMLGSMTSDKLCPQAMANEHLELIRRSSQKVEEKESTLFRCPHCNERRCTYREVQRRSLDEAPDYMCRCLNCDRRFTGHN